jgi:protein-arginine kinase
MSDDPIDTMSQSAQQILFALAQTVQQLAQQRERREQIRVTAAYRATSRVLRSATTLPDANLRVPLETADPSITPSEGVGGHGRTR